VSFALSEAEIVWSAPFGTLKLPGLTSIRYGEAASTSDDSSSIADIALRRNAGPSARASSATSAMPPSAIA